MGQILALASQDAVPLLDFFNAPTVLRLFRTSSKLRGHFLSDKKKLRLRHVDLRSGSDKVARSFVGSAAFGDVLTLRIVLSSIYELPEMPGIDLGNRFQFPRTQFVRQISGGTIEQILAAFRAAAQPCVGLQSLLIKRGDFLLSVPEISTEGFLGMLSKAPALRVLNIPAFRHIPARPGPVFFKISSETQRRAFFDVMQGVAQTADIVCFNVPFSHPLSQDEALQLRVMLPHTGSTVRAYIVDDDRGTPFSIRGDFGTPFPIPAVGWPTFFFRWGNLSSRIITTEVVPPDYAEPWSSLKGHHLIRAQLADRQWNELDSRTQE